MDLSESCRVVRGSRKAHLNWPGSGRAEPTLSLIHISRQLEQLRQLESQRLQLQANAQALSEKEDMLSQALVRLEQWELHQRRRQLEQAECTAQASQQRLDTLRRQLEEERVPENETIGRLRGAIVNLETVRKAVDKARAERDKALKRCV